MCPAGYWNEDIKLLWGVRMEIFTWEPSIDVIIYARKSEPISLECIIERERKRVGERKGWREWEKIWDKCSGERDWHYVLKDHRQEDWIWLVTRIEFSEKWWNYSSSCSHDSNWYEVNDGFRKGQRTTQLPKKLGASLGDLKKSWGKLEGLHLKKLLTISLCSKRTNFEKLWLLLL